jgi:hypothetical protein
MKWDRSTPNEAPSHTQFIEYLLPDHPVHKMSKEEQEKLRAKGVNPVLKAEMHDKVYKKGEGQGLWNNIARTTLGGGWIK